MDNNEIISTEVIDILKEVKNLTETNWIKVPSRHIENVNFVICAVKCEVFKGQYMILKDAVTIHFESIEFIYSSRTIPLDMLGYYIDLLINQENKRNVVYISNLMNHQLKINDTIIFDSDKKGIILPPKEEYLGLLHYKMIKKNGELGIKELNLYRDVKYAIQGREFIDYEKLLNL